MFEYVHFHLKPIVTADIKPRLLSSTKKDRHVVFKKTSSLGQEKTHVCTFETGIIKQKHNIYLIDKGHGLKWSWAKSHWMIAELLCAEGTWAEPHTLGSQSVGYPHWSWVEMKLTKSWPKSDWMIAELLRTEGARAKPHAPGSWSVGMIKKEGRGRAGLLVARPLFVPTDWESGTCTYLFLWVQSSLFWSSNSFTFNTFYLNWLMVIGLCNHSWAPCIVHVS